jgi:hypothetical protein
MAKKKMSWADILRWSGAILGPIVAFVAIYTIPVLHRFFASHTPRLARDYFSESTGICMAAISLLLCFEKPIKMLGNKKNRYALSAACSFIFCIGFIGSMDSKRGAREAERKISDLAETLAMRPTREEIRAMLDAPKKETPLSSSDFILKIFDDIMGPGTSVTPKIIKGKPALFVKAANNSDRTIYDPLLMVEVPGCRLEPLEDTPTTLRTLDPSQIGSSFWRESKINPGGGMAFMFGILCPSGISKGQVIIQMNNNKPVWLPFRVRYP